MMWLSFFPIAQLSIYLWFASHQQGVQIKPLLFKTSIYSTCHFPSNREKLQGLYTEMQFPNGNVRGRKIFAESKMLYLQSISIPYMQRIPFSTLVLCFHISWCKSYSGFAPRWFNHSLMNTWGTLPGSLEILRWKTNILQQAIYPLKCNPFLTLCFTMNKTILQEQGLNLEKKSHHELHNSPSALNHLPCSNESVLRTI